MFKNLVILLVLAYSTMGSAAVDLHAHLFMEDGVPGWLYDGCFDCPLEGKTWEDRFSSKGNKDALIKSDLQLVVVALYAHTLASGSIKENIRAQIARAERFVKENPSWIIAKSPNEAEQAMRTGKRSLVLSLEGADGALDNDEDFREFIDEKGIRIVTLIHLKDDQYGGAGFMKGWMAWLNPWARMGSIFSESKNGETTVNPRGLTDFGKGIVKKLIEKHVWIDLSHSSDKSIDDISLILKEQNQVPLYTHTILREFHGAERGISEDQLNSVRVGGGVVGVIPSARMMIGTKVVAGECGVHCSPPCSESMAGFGQQFRHFKNVLGPGNVFIGSDMNAPVNGLAPGCPEGSRLGNEGYWRLDQVPELYSALGFNNPEQVLKNFLAAWRRAVGEAPLEEIKKGRSVKNAPSKKQRN